MRLSKSKKDFIEASKNGPLPPLYKEIPFGSPVSIYPLFSGANSFLLESVKGPLKIAMYSFIGFEPYSVLKVKDHKVEIQTKGRKTLSSRRPLEKLSELVQVYIQKPSVELPPFQGGAAGLLSYDFVHYFEKLPKTTTDDINIPDAHFLMLDKLIAFDHASKKAWVIACPGANETALGYPEPGASGLAEKFDEAEHQINRISNILNSSRQPYLSRGLTDIEVIHEMAERDYTDMVMRAKEYIASGDIFQANLSLRAHAHIGSADPWKIYTALRSINPSPFSGFFDFGDYFLVSSSPERLLRVSGSTAETRPIAGTRPRGKNRAEDEAMRTELLLNEKEKAEHTMLIDLERNDLGRVCDYGSIEVDELMTTEDYSHVIHIVSNIRGRLAKGKNMFDAVRAAFPGGTITGVPKVRCMEIIDELEPLRRGPYTGSMGYLGFSGNMDMNIVIRSFLIKNSTAYVQAGAGIVADSDPEREYHETMKKAEALILTLKGL